MPIVTDGAMMAPDRGIDELGASFGQSIGATAAESWADSPLSQLMAGSQIAGAAGEAPDMGRLNDPFGGVDLTEEVKPAVPRLDMIDAIDRVKKAGLDKHLTLPDQPDMPQSQLEIMIRNARARAEREATIERGPQGFIPSALQVGTSFLVGAADPINLASAFIPIMGELRYGKLLAAVGESATARLATRAAVGAGQGAVGQAALEPLDWWAHTQEGRDFGMSDVLRNIMFGAALGGGLQAGGGFISDAYRARQGRAQFPYDVGEPLEGHTPWEDLRTQPQPPPLPRDVLGEFPGLPEQRAAELEASVADIESRYAEAPSPEVATINDLPPRAHEDAMRASIADLIEGNPVRAGDMIEAAARTDPRIAESIPRAGQDAGSWRSGPEAVRAAIRDLVADEGAANRSVVISPVDNPDVVDVVGAHVSGFVHTIDNHAIRHVLKSHGDPATEARRGQLAVTREDFALVPDILGAPDSVSDVGVNRRGQAMVLYEKKIGDAFFYVEEAREGRRELAMATMYKRGEGSGADRRPAAADGPAGQTPETYRPDSEDNVREGGAPAKGAGADRIGSEIEPPRSRGRAAAHPDTWSLFELLAKEGGLRPDPELEAIFGSAKSPFVPGFGALVRQNGRTLDDALRLAKDHGYLFDEADVSGTTPRLTPNDLLDRLAEENAGRRQYKLDQQHATKAEVQADLERERHEIISALHDEIEAATGQKGVKVDPVLEKRVVEIVQKEGESDVLAAYERAIMEDAERYEAISRERQQHPETAHIAGWDPDEPAGASADGGAAAGQRGQPGLPDQGPGRADGGQPRGAGAGDRGALPTELDKASAWRGIAAQTPDFNTPEQIAASNAAAKVEPPPAELDGRVTAATKAEAYSQKMYDMFAHRLPPEERARLDEALARLEREKADFDTVAQRGAACLFEGSQG